MIDLVVPGDKLRFVSGPRMRGLGGVLWTSPDPLDAFADVLCWLSWVAKLCPMSEVSDVDTQSGYASFVSWLGLGDDFDGTIVSTPGETAT